MKQRFGKMKLEVTPVDDGRGWYMTVAEAARGYGVDRTTVMTHLREHADELRDGIEKAAVGIPNSRNETRPKPVLYRDGVIKLGFFVKSEQAVAFRQWATDLVVEKLEGEGVATGKQFFEYLDKKFEEHSKRFDDIEAISKNQTGRIGVLEETVEYLEEALGLYWTVDEKDRIKEEVRLTAELEKTTKQAVIGAIRAGCDISRVYTKDSAKKVINFLRARRGAGIRIVKDEEGSDEG